MRSNMDHINAYTNKPYAGINQDELSNVADKKGYESNKWVTFVQARDMNLRIKKGEHGVLLKRVIDTERRVKTSGGYVTKPYTAIRYFRVFNLDQTEVAADMSALAEIV